MQVDDDVVEATADRGDRIRHALGFEGIGVQGRRRQRDDPHARRVVRCEIDEGRRRLAVHQVAPAVDDGLDLLEPERDRDVTGHRVGVDEEDLLALPDLEGGGEVHGDRRLPDAALRVEDRDDRRALAPQVGIERTGAEDRAAAVVDGEAADAHRLDAPAHRLGGVGTRQVLVVGPGCARIEALEGALRDDHEARDRLFLVVEDRVVLERLVKVRLAVEDGDGDVAPLGEDGFELVRPADDDRLEPRLAQLGRDRCGLGGRKRDGDCGTRHRSLPRAVGLRV